MLSSYMKKLAILVVAIFLCAILFSGWSWIDSISRGVGDIQEGVESFKVPEFDSGISTSSQKIEHVCGEDISCI